MLLLALDVLIEVDEGLATAAAQRSVISFSAASNTEDELGVELVCRSSGLF